MSWYIHKVGAKDNLIAKIMEDKGVPEVGQAHILQGLRMAEHAPDEVLMVESIGHLDTCGGNSALKISKVKLVLSLLILFAVAALTGCGTFGKNAGPPTAIEQRLFTTVTNIVPMVQTITNVVEVTRTNQVVQTVTVTNSIGVPVLVPVTNYHTSVSWQTNTATITNLVGIPQLQMGAGSNTTVAVASGIGGMFGYGGLISVALTGLFAGYLKLRNNALAGQATVANQVSGALTQNIETLLNVLQSTPQGAAVMPQIKNYLMAHQTQAGVIQDVAGIIKDFVDEPAAQQSAQEILKALNTLQTAPGAAAKV